MSDIVERLRRSAKRGRLLGYQAHARRDDQAADEIERLRALHIDTAGQQDDTISALRAEVERLKAAISLHRRNVWGSGPVDHDVDVELYRALEDK